MKKATRRRLLLAALAIVLTKLGIDGLDREVIMALVRGPQQEVEAAEAASTDAGPVLPD